MSITIPPYTIKVYRVTNLTHLISDTCRRQTEWIGTNAHVLGVIVLTSANHKFLQPVFVEFFSN